MSARRPRPSSEESTWPHLSLELHTASSRLTSSMPTSARRSRTRLIISVAVIAVIAAGGLGWRSIKGAAPAIDPSRLGNVERGTMVRSVVATGKVEPITKVEIKSKANGIIKVLHVDVDSVVDAGDVLVELDKDQLMAAMRGAEANLEAARAALEAADAQLKKN